MHFSTIHHSFIQVVVNDFWIFFKIFKSMLGNIYLQNKQVLLCYILFLVETKFEI